MNSDPKLTSLFSSLNLIFDPKKKHFGFQNAQLLLAPPKNEIKGFPLKVSSTDTDFLIKILPLDLRYPLDSHPSLLEIYVPKLLNQFRTESPHVVHIFNSIFVRNNASALTSYPIKNYHGEIYEESAVLMAEFVNGGCIERYIDKLSNDNVSPKLNKLPISESDWKNIIFQILWTIAIFQDKFEFMHNDFHAGNILVQLLDNPKDFVKYKWYAKRNCITFTLPLSRFQTKITDFEFSQCFVNDNLTANLYPNDFCFDHSDIPEYFNPHYDTHFFLTSLLEFDIPASIRKFIISLFPTYIIPSFSGASGASPDSVHSSFSNYTDTQSSDNTFYKTDQDFSLPTPEPEHEPRNDDDSLSGSSTSRRRHSIDSFDSQSQYTDTDSTQTDEDAYIKRGRLLNDKYDLIKHLLPSPLQLIFCHPFFEEYRTEGSPDIIVQDTFRYHSSHGGDPRKIRKLPWNAKSTS